VNHATDPVDFLDTLGEATMTLIQRNLEAFIRNGHENFDRSGLAVIKTKLDSKRIPRGTFLQSKNFNLLLRSVSWTLCRDSWDLFCLKNTPENFAQSLLAWKKEEEGGETEFYYGVSMITPPVDTPEDCIITDAQLNDLRNDLKERRRQILGDAKVFLDILVEELYPNQNLHTSKRSVVFLFLI
jgi:hypothetical protein